MRVHRSEPAPGNLEDIFLYLAPATAPRPVAWSSASSMSPTTRAYAVTNERIDILAVRERRGLRISVVDSGPGIARDQLDRVFEAFYSTKREGLGLGLAICRSIINAHGGRLWATSDGRHGSAFHFTLPEG